VPDLPSRLDYYSIGRQWVLQRAQKIDPGMVDVAGSDVNIIVGVGSVLADAVTKQIGYAANKLLLDGAQDEDLDRYAWDRYQLVRKGASPATGQVRFYRASTTAGAGTIPVGTVLTTLAGTQYITTQPATFGSSTLDLVYANVQATQSGKATQVGANNIQRIQSPNTLFDTSIQVNNDLTTGGGEDVEDDDTFKNRIRSFWASSIRGTLAAIEFGALTVAGVVSANAVEALTSGALPARIVNLYISDSSGVASVVMAQAVANALNDYRAGGIAVIISLSIPLIEPIVLNLSFQPGVDTVTLAAQVQAAVVEFVNSLGVNETLALADLYSVLQRFRAQGLVPSIGSIVSPVGDVVPTGGQTIRTTPQQVTLQQAA
jgi:uncharacterized phage protein gp47/JayE